MLARQRSSQHLIFVFKAVALASRLSDFMKEDLLKHRGDLVSVVLGGAWRRPPATSLSLSKSQLDEVTPLLYGSGAAALGWWRVRDTELGKTSSAEVLHQAYRLLVLQSAIHEEHIKTVFRLLRGHSIEAILVKGWVAAGLYPERALRPYGDIDLCVKTSDWKTASEVLASPEAAGCWTDLHEGFSELNDRTIDQLFERSRLLDLEDVQVRVLSPEDHLALLAIHLLKHGAWRPLWLCDIGAAIESLPSDFDWDICLGHNKRRAGWIACAIGLAHRLLGARIQDLPTAIRNQKLPDWLVHNVLKQWENPFATNQPPMSHPLPIMESLRHPNGIWKAIRARWPNPIIATISVNGKLNGAPRFPYQLGNCVSRLGRFLAHLPKELRD